MLAEVVAPPRPLVFTSSPMLEPWEGLLTTDDQVPLQELLILWVWSRACNLYS